MTVTHVYILSEFRRQQNRNAEWRMAQTYKPSKRTRMRSVRLDFVWMRRFSQRNKDDSIRGALAKAKR